MSGAKVQTASIESGGSAQDSGAEYGSDAAQSGALDGESSFNQDPLALAQTDPLTSSESAEKKTLSSARRPGIHLNIPPAFWIIIGVAAVAAIIGSRASYGEIPH